MTLGHIEFRANSDAGSILERRPRSGVSLKDGDELARVRISPQGPNPRVDMYVLTPVKIQSEGGIGFFWDLLPAESILRALLGVFPTGQAATAQVGGAALLNRYYMTAITSLADEAAAREAGFYILDPSFRRHGV
jgi:hypothetical protein